MYMYDLITLLYSRNWHNIVNQLYFNLKNDFFFFYLFAISWAAPAAYGDSQARGLIRAVATGLHQSHSNA